MTDQQRDPRRVIDEINEQKQIQSRRLRTTGTLLVTSRDKKHYLGTAINFIELKNKKYQNNVFFYYNKKMQRLYYNPCMKMK